MQQMEVQMRLETSFEGTEYWWHYTRGFSFLLGVYYCKELSVCEPRTLLL